MPNGVAQESVFISYSHKDKAACTDLIANLTAQGIRVEHDDTSLQTGDELTRTIQKYIVSTDFTICLISEYSLQSSWVLWEIKQALDQQGQQAEKKFLPAYLDKSFEDDNKIQDIVDGLEKRIKELDTSIRAELDYKRGIEHLTAERDSMLRAQHELPAIVNFLKHVVITDLRPAGYEAGFKQLYKSITGKSELLQALISRDQTENTDYFSRQEAIFELVTVNDLPEAANKSMDLVKQFFPANKPLLTKIRLLSAGIRRCETEYREMKQTNKEQIIALVDHYDKKMDKFAASLMELVPDEYSSVT